MLTCISTAQARTKCVSAFWADSGARHFSCQFLNKVALIVKFLYKMALVMCGPRFWGATFFVQISALGGSCEILACISTAQARAKCVCVYAFWADSGARHFSCKILDKVTFVKMLKCISPAQARTKCGPRFWGAAFFL